MIIMGIDPGLNQTGIGLLRIKSKQMEYVAHVLVKTSAKDSFIMRLGNICEKIAHTIDQYEPKYAAVEDIFYATNIKTAIVLGQVKGAIIANLIGKGVSIFEYSALQIKKSVVGYGKADKNQVKKLVEIHLKKSFDGVPYDCTDALACGVCLGLNISSAVF